MGNQSHTVLAYLTVDCIKYKPNWQTGYCEPQLTYTYLCITPTGQANLQDKVATLQGKVINLQDKVDTFQNTTEASTRKSYHEVVELLQNMSCSLDGKTQVADNLILELHTI